MSFANEACLHHLFHNQVLKRGEAVAIECNGDSMTYEELDRRSNQIAHYLRKQGVAPEVQVGLFMHHSPTLVICLLGILKAGGAYVPLDPDYPPERLRFVVGDAQLQLLVTHQALAERVPEYCEQIVDVDLVWEAIRGERDTDPTTLVDPDTIAYVIYTSGSTGKPKGTMLAHRGACNLIQAICEIFPVTTESRILLFASISFDASVSEIFMALAAGAVLVLVPGTRASLAYRLAEIVRDKAVTTVTLPPSVLSTLDLLEDSALKTVVSAGESCAWSIIEGIPPGTRLLNGYGPTETTIGTAYYLASSRIGGASTVPLGWAIPQSYLYILDQAMEPAPIGFPGEIYIGGIGLARGYLCHADLTAERFLPDPFSEVPGARLYRTGDKGRYLPNGAIVYLGRVDQQVKLGGVRVELGEIEALLSQHPAVKEAVVLLNEEVDAEKWLNAYVTVKSHNGIEVAALHRFLRNFLPAPMLPATISVLEAFPLTPNGKIDRRALPEPTQKGYREDQPPAPPQTPLELQIAEIWREVLKIERISMNDDFFVLGGNSLLAICVLSRLRSVFLVELSIHTFFEHPTITGIIEGIERLPREAQLHGEETIWRDRDRWCFPLTSSQQRIWFLCQLEAQSPFYNTTEVFSIKGPLQPLVLEQAIHEIGRRHEVLRTTFTLLEDQPVQIISPEVQLVLTRVDLQTLPVAKREQAVKEYIEEEARKVFHLSSGPLLRFTLLSSGPDVYVLLLSIHHIIADGWSSGILLQELEALYRAFSASQSAALPELPIQYRDVLSWENHTSHKQILEQQRLFWRDQLANPPPLLNLPSDRLRPASLTFKGATCDFFWPEQLTNPLRKLARGEGATLFMVLLTALKIILFRYTGQTDLLIGTPVANRVRPEFEGLIGCFTNMLVIRSTVEGDRTFREQLRYERQRCLQAFEHQEAPFEQLVADQLAQRDLSYMPLVQIVLTLQNAGFPVLHLPGCEIVRQQPDVGATPFDLNVFVEEHGEALVGSIQYSTDLFEHETIERLIEHFSIVLSSAIEHPDYSLALLPFLGDSERQVLTSWNTVTVSEVPATCLHRVFEKWAISTPDAIAIEYEGHLLSYGELNERAERLAVCLRRKGVAPEMLVGLLMERSCELIIGIIGIFKAGGAYVPLDPAYPQERLTFMLQDAGVQMVVIQDHLRSRLPVSTVDILAIEHIWSDGTLEEIIEQHEDKIDVDTLAYVIYTSGSTGKPKGVGITHHNVRRLFSSTQSCFGFGSHDAWTLFHSYAFDFSVWEMWGPLLYGGRLVVVSYWVSRSIEDFCILVAQKGITVLNQTPSVFRQFMEVDGRSSQRPALRLVIFGGEVLYPDSLKPWVERHGDQTPRLINMYGITETCVHVTYQPLTCQEIMRSSMSLIGCPIPDLQVYVLDANYQLAPIGVPGELYVGGPGLARGYLHRPDATAARFVPHPFNSAIGARLYRTGDLGRYLMTGQLEYLGRADQQVKVHGFRIELQEIEAILKQYPQVLDAVVNVWEPVPGDQRLVAYIVSSDGRLPSTSELQIFLKVKLPAYMVPSLFVALLQVPLNGNNKLDRDALPVPELNRAVIGEHFVSPNTPCEQQLAQIWIDVLSIEKIGIHDNFFELGGHSLLATQVISRIRSTMNVEFPIHRFFEAPTIAALAEAIAPHMRDMEGNAALDDLFNELQSLSDEDKARLLLLDEDQGKVRTDE